MKNDDILQYLAEEKKRTGAFVYFHEDGIVIKTTAGGFVYIECTACDNYSDRLRSVLDVLSTFHDA